LPDAARQIHPLHHRSAGVRDEQNAVRNHAVAAVPRVEADPTAMIVFAALFVALIGGFLTTCRRKATPTRRRVAQSN
jgi:hypothetical protein